MAMSTAARTVACARRSGRSPSIGGAAGSRARAARSRWERRMARHWIASLPGSRQESGMVDRQERTAIVTGAGKRVGAEIARALLDDGWKVVAHVRHETDDPPSGTIKAVADLTDVDCADTI